MVVLAAGAAVEFAGDLAGVDVVQAEEDEGVEPQVGHLEHDGPAVALPAAPGHCDEGTRPLVACAFGSFAEGAPDRLHSDPDLDLPECHAGDYGASARGAPRLPKRHQTVLGQGSDILLDVFQVAAYKPSQAVQ